VDEAATLELHSCGCVSLPSIGRLGTPDALATVLVTFALSLMDQRMDLRLGLLFVSLGVRTDNILILFTVLIWLAWEKRLPRRVASALALLRWVSFLGLIIGREITAGSCFSDSALLADVTRPKSRTCSQSESTFTSLLAELAEFMRWWIVLPFGFSWAFWRGAVVQTRCY
jgi:hypothetical protein